MTVRDGLKATIGARKYVVDLSRFSRRPLPAVKQQVDFSGEPGEQSLSNDGIWRKTARDFILGAGQEFFDERDESSPLRFYTSKGIDPWERRSIQLHYDTTLVEAATDTNLKLAVANGRMYLTEGQTLRQTADGATWTTVSGTPAATATDITSDGFHPFISFGASGIYRVASAGSAAASLSAYNASIVGYGNGRLLAARDNVLVEVNADGSTTTVMTHDNTDFDWQAIRGAANGIYVTGDAGENGEIYLVTIIDATGELAAPFWANGLEGETFNDMYAYGGVLVLATSRGVRLGLITGSGFLSLAPAIDEPGEVLCLEPQNEFCWFGWTNYDGTSTGLGRLKLDRFADELTPAFASDLMATTQGAVTSVVTFGGKRYFAVSGVGVYQQSTDRVASGVYRSGWITWSVPERKSITGIEVRHDALPAGSSVACAVVEDDNSTTTVTTSNTTDALGKAADVTAIDTETVQVQLTLARATDATTGPKVRRWTLRALPLPYRSEELIFPIYLKNQIKEDFTTPIKLDTLAEWQYLQGLQNSRARVAIVLGGETLTATIEVSLPEGETIGWNDKINWVETTAVVRAVTVQAAA